MLEKGPDIQEIADLRAALAAGLLRTPIVRCATLEAIVGDGTEITAKLEFLQRTGTFKARGALATLRSLSPEQLAAGVTAVSAGNHAIATAYAAQAMGTTARVVMVSTANPARIEACRGYGAEVVLAEDVHEAFDVVQTIQQEEGRYFVHPFEGRSVALGTGTLGLEIAIRALELSGGTEVLANMIVHLTSGAAPWMVLTLVLVVTMFVSDLINNAATALIMAPIAVEIARGLGVATDPFLMAVAVGASCAFLTPIGHQSNTLVMGPGGYKFGDYWRMGLPLEAVIAAVAVPLILRVWPLG